MSASVKGRLVLISAPSGAGKTSLVHKYLALEPRARFSVSYTTRERRPKEVEGVDYTYVSKREFEAMVERGEFLEHAQVFDNCYGTGREHVSSLVDAGSIVILEIDWQGAAQVRDKVPEVLSVFVMPPSYEELERRLRGRATDSAAVIERRLRDAYTDMTHWHEFDYVIINDDLATALAQLAAIVAGDDSVPTTADPGVRAAVEAILADCRPTT